MRSGRLRGGRVEHAAHRARGSRRSRRRGRPPRPRAARPRRLQPRVRRRRGARSRPPGARAPRTARDPRRAAAPRRPRPPSPPAASRPWLHGGRPAARRGTRGTRRRHGTPRQLAQPLRDRAATDAARPAPARRAARRAARRSAVNATQPAAPRGRSAAPAATSTARQRRSVTIPSSRAAATWQSDTAIAPIARSAVGRGSRARRPTARTQRGSADSIAEQLEPAVGVAPLRHAGSSRTPLSVGAARRATRPTPRSGPKSCTKPNTTSAIVGPSATAIESAWCGSPRLAFSEPSIGSIDDEHVARLAEVDPPALLADRA